MLMLGANLITALAVSAAAILLMVFTILKNARRAEPNAGSGGATETRSQADSEPGIKFLRVGFTELLVFFCLSLLALGIGAVMGSVSVSEIWRLLEEAALAETLAFGVFRKIRNR
jgi:hypothetical protein